MTNPARTGWTRTLDNHTTAFYGDLGGRVRAAATLAAHTHRPVTVDTFVAAANANVGAAVAVTVSPHGDMDITATGLKAVGG